MSQCDVIHAGHGTCKQAGMVSRCAWCKAAELEARLAAARILNRLESRAGIGDQLDAVKADDPAIYLEIEAELADVVLSSMAYGSVYK